MLTIKIVGCKLTKANIVMPAVPYTYQYENSAPITSYTLEMTYEPSYCSNPFKSCGNVYISPATISGLTINMEKNVINIYGTHGEPGTYQISLEYCEVDFTNLSVFYTTPSTFGIDLITEYDP